MNMEYMFLRSDYNFVHILLLTGAVPQITAEEQSEREGEPATLVFWPSLFLRTSSYTF